jgi:hypothetical protein
LDPRKRRKMLCRHRQILFEWLQDADDDKQYRVVCQHCGQKFSVVWIGHDEPGPETNWEWGAVQEIELLKEGDD